MDAKKFPLTESGNYSFQGERNGNTGRISEIKFINHLGTGASIELKEEPSDKYSGKGSASVINGVVGSSEKYGGNEWLGFEGKDFSATIDLGEMKPIKAMSMRFFKGEGQWIYFNWPGFLSSAVKVEERICIGHYAAYRRCNNRLISAISFGNIGSDPGKGNRNLYSCPPSMSANASPLGKAIKSAGLTTSASCSENRSEFCDIKSTGVSGSLLSVIRDSGVFV